MNRIVAFALKQQALMAALFVFVCVAGLVSFMRLDIEAYPDPVPPLVDIVAQNAGQSAEEMERYVTIPLEIQMAGIPHVSAIRTISLFGLSDVKLQFTYDVTYEEAEQMAIDQLAQLSSLPSGVKPQISPCGARSARIFRSASLGPNVADSGRSRTGSSNGASRRVGVAGGKQAMSDRRSAAERYSQHPPGMTTTDARGRSAVASKNADHRRVEAEMDRINASGILPPGVHLERIYDRSELIGLTTEKVLTNLTFGIILIFAVQWLFLGSLRSAIVVSATIPFALFFAVMLLVLFGESANLLSVGAIDFGLIVDATVILVENVFRRRRGRGGSAVRGSVRGHVRARRPLRQARRHRRRDRRGRSRRAVLRADHHRRLRGVLMGIRRTVLNKRSRSTTCSRKASRP